jgi:hypothetical protein
MSAYEALSGIPARSYGRADSYDEEDRMIIAEDKQGRGDRNNLPLFH